MGLLALSACAQPFEGGEAAPRTQQPQTSNTDWRKPYHGDFAIEGTWRQVSPEPERGRAIVFFKDGRTNLSRNLDSYTLTHEDNRYTLETTSSRTDKRSTYRVQIASKDHIRIGSREFTRVD
jgi:hypothetical protein